MYIISISVGISKLAQSRKQWIKWSTHKGLANIANWIILFLNMKYCILCIDQLITMQQYSTLYIIPLDSYSYKIE